jgi:polysaccharide chain length determinant protein (PEP-CTERM system associated)
MNFDRFELFSLISAFWRRRWYVLASAWLVSLLGWAVVVILPDKYESEARVYIDTSSLLGPLLRGIAVANDVEQEVAFMQRTLLSRPNLQEVARATDLDLEVTTPIELEKLLGRLKGDARIKAQGGNLFTVSYTDKDPVLAKSIVQALLTIFVESNLGQTRQDMESARSFIETQLETYERQLKEAEIRRAEFKVRNGDVLAGGTFAAQVSTATSGKNQARRAYEDAVIRKNQLSSQLKVVPQFLKVNAPPQVILERRQPSAQEKRIESLQENLDLLLIRYTENHPDVIAAKRGLEALRKSLRGVSQDTTDEKPGADKDSANKAEIPNSLYEKLRLDLSDVETTISMLERNLKEAEQANEDLEKLRVKAPEVEAQLADLDRDYDVIKKKYNEFLTRRESARISQAAEASTDSVQFRIIAPPQVPVVPSAPNRLLLLTVVLVGGLGVGGGVAFLLVQMDDTFSTSNRLSDTFGIPVLGVVNMIAEPSQKFRRTMGNLAFAMAFTSLSAVFGALVILAPKLSQLSALLKKQSLPSELSFLTDIIGTIKSLSFLQGLF